MADIITRFKLETTQYDSKLRDAAKGLQAFVHQAELGGKGFNNFSQRSIDAARSLGNVASGANNLKDKVKDLVGAYNDAAKAYNKLTQEQQQSDFGKALSQSLTQLQGRIKDAKQELYGLGDAAKGKFGEFGNVLDTLGSKMGVTGNLTEMLTSRTAMLTGAVGAGIAIVTKATEAWAGYNAELAKQDQITTVTTGLKGDDADRMTDTMRALADTYNVDFREAVNAANTLMTQFGKTGDEATQLIKDGMQGMIQGDGPKLLSMIQQYAPAFRDAGVSASQLVAVIQNSEGGIFTDQNMNAIVMGIKNIRLMTKATSDALAQLGIDGEKMSEQLSNGTLTIFDALKQVSHQLQTVDSNSKTAGEVMQQVFGRQGVTAGTNLAKAIETLNTNLDETKRQTGEVGQSLADLQTANERLNTAIRDAFGYDGWDKMAQGIKTKLVGALSDVIEHLAIIEEGFGKLFGRGNNKPKPQKEADYSKFGSYQVTTDSDGNVLKATKWNRGKAIDMTDYERTQQGYTVTGNMSKSGSKGGTGNKTLKPEKDEMVEIVGLIGEANERVSDLQKRMRESWDQNEIATLRKQLKEAQNDLDVLQGKLPKDSKVEMTITADDTDALQKVKDIEDVTFDEKTMTVTANTQEALQKVQELVADVDGKVLNVKVVPLITDEDIDNQLQRQYGKAIQVPITPKLTAGEELVQSIRIKLSKDNINADMQTLRTLLETQIKNDIEGIDIPTNWLIDQLFGENPADIPDEYWKNFQDQINEKLKDMGRDQLDIDFKTGDSKKKEKKEKSPIEGSKQLVSGLSQVAGGLQQMGVKLPEEVQQVLGVVQGLMTVIEGVNTVIGITQTAALTANTTAMVALTAALWANTTASIIPFAGGGIVKAAMGTIVGNSYSGDNLRGISPDGQIYGLNAGEVVLNKSQVGNIASQLGSGGLGNLHLETYVDGRALRIVLNNESQGRLKGKYVTSNNVR